MDVKQLEKLKVAIQNREIYAEEVARFESVLKVCRPEFEEKLTANIERNRAWLRACEDTIKQYCKLIAED